jgi:hypothetical protein
MRSRIPLTLIVFLLLRCATVPTRPVATVAPPTFESLSSACGESDLDSCFKAADFVWNLSPSDLNPCRSSDEAFCIKPEESGEQAYARLSERSAAQFGLACEKGRNAEACVRAGSTLAIMGIDLPANEYEAVAARAEAYFDKACELGSQHGCMLRGTTHRAGT